jgi:hypothetical protein
MELIPITAGGQTGNNTHAGVPIVGYSALAFEFVVEVAGATPTVTWKIQASPDDLSVTDGNAHWYDLGYITDATDTISVATRTATAAGAQIEFISNPVARQYRRFRLVTTANTNVTYRGEAYRIP